MAEHLYFDSVLIFLLTAIRAYARPLDGVAPAPVALRSLLHDD